MPAAREHLMMFSRIRWNDEFKAKNTNDEFTL
jgi:hypothetical protein